MAKNRQNGLAAVELTIALPFILLLFLIAVDFGRVMFEAITTSSSARIGAGYGAQSTSLVQDSVNINSTALTDSVSLKVNDGDSTAIGVSNRYFCRCSGDSKEVSCTTTCGTNLEVYVEVTTTRTFKTISNFPGIPESVHISRTATIRAQ